MSLSIFSKKIEHLSITTLFLLLIGCTQQPIKKVENTPIIIQTADYIALTIQKNDSYQSLARQYLKGTQWAWYIAEFNSSSLQTPLIVGDRLIIPRTIKPSTGINKGYYQSVPVLTYHNISQKPNNKKGVQISADNFVAQMQYLHDNHYHVIPLAKMFDFIERQEPLPKKSVVISFDDGWRSTYDIAYPILKKYGYPFTIFVYTDLITGSASTLSWEMIKEMHDQGVDIQNHTKTHTNLGENTKGLKPKQFLNFIDHEIIFAAKKIKQKIGKQVEFIAYPYGANNTLTRAVLKKYNYRGGLTVTRGGNSFFQDPLQVHRSMIYNHTTLAQFSDYLQTQQKID